MKNKPGSSSRDKRPYHHCTSNHSDRSQPVYALFGIVLCLTVLPAIPGERDTFGITCLYPSRPGTIVWHSAHWNNGIPRTVRYGSDPYDPTDWTEDHSSGTDGFRIDGAGTMTMSGSGPRFHINSLDSSKTKPQFYRDVEFTAYYQRRGATGKNWGGMVVGVRSGPLGHASAGGNDCDATTYYARFRNDGTWDFEKELKHPGSTYWSGSGFNRQDPLWKGAPLPQYRWIGMKYVVYNIAQNTRVRLELYIDTLSNGSPDRGGSWELVGSVVDSGNWPSGDVSGCPYSQNAVIVDGNGTILMRTDGDTAVYTMVSVREILAPATDTRNNAKERRTFIHDPEYHLRCVIDGHIPRSLDRNTIQHSIDGRIHVRRAVRNGVYLIKKDRGSIRRDPENK